MSEETTIVLLRMPETGEGISFREVLDNCSYTVTEAFAKLFKIAEEAGYRMKIETMRHIDEEDDNIIMFTDRGLCLILTPPAPEPVDEWMVWCNKMPSWEGNPIMAWEDKMKTWYKSMPRCKCGKGEPE